MPMNPRLLRPSSTFTPRSISGLALWLDAADSSTLYTTDAGPVTAVSSPLDIAGCALWLDGADSSAASMTLDGTAVGSWLDKSGNNRHFTATGSARPTLTSSVINGRSAVTFNGSTTTMAGNAAAQAVIRNLPGYTVFSVLRTASVAAGERLAFGVGVTVLFRIGRQDSRPAVGGRRAYADTLESVIGASGTLSVGVAYIQSATVNHAAQTLVGLHNGAAFGTDATYVSAGNSENSLATVCVGTQGDGAFGPWDGEVAELIVYPTALSPTDRARVEAYLAAKWGISGVHAPATATNDPVGAWLDKSGNGRHATQATAASRPTVSATKQGGRTAVAFASSTRTVTSPATVAQYVADATTSPKMFFAWVARPEGGNAGITFGTAPTNPNSSSRVFFASDYGGFGTHIVDFGSIGGARLTGTVGDEENNAGHVYSAYRDGSVVSVRRDGVEILRKTNASGSYTATNGTLSLNTAEAGSSTASWMEFMAYAASLPAASIARLERYLAAKWGITLAPQVSNADAQDWVNRVYANGGTVSATTAEAVNQFCVDIENAGIRDRFYRVNLFCGNSDASLAAVRTPLFRGPSLTGTQFGNATDTNLNFVQGDYAETGASGGLTGNGTSKYLNTGFPTNTLSVGDRHLAFYANTWPNSTFRDFIGSESAAAAGAQQFALGHQLDADRVHFRYTSGSGRISSSVISGGAFWVGTNGTTTAGRILRNGVFNVDGVTSLVATPTSSQIFVFAINRASTPGPESLFPGRSSGYSIGAHMTDAQALAYYTAMQAFQTALGRQV